MSTRQRWMWCTSWGCESKLNKKHGMTRTPTWNSWFSMIARCKYPKLPYFKNYGGRGITVCKRWLEFINFLADMGIRPNGKTLNRRNNNKSYYKRNCKWSTPKEQMINRRKMDNLGEKNPQAKLTKCEVLMIRARKGTWTAEELAKRFKVNSRHIYRL